MAAHWTSGGLRWLEWPGTPENAGIAEETLAGRTAKTWASALESALHAYFQGDFQQLDLIPVDRSGWTPFFGEVYQACRDIPPGETMSYAQLAAKSGRSGAARAVGQAMATNRIPLVIPCHRVVGTGGRLCGYSGPGGLETKQRLLDLELASLTGIASLTACQLD